MRGRGERDVRLHVRASELEGLRGRRVDSRDGSAGVGENVAESATLRLRWIEAAAGHRRRNLFRFARGPRKTSALALALL